MAVAMGGNVLSAPALLLGVATVGLPKAGRSIKQHGQHGRYGQRSRSGAWKAMLDEAGLHSLHSLQNSAMTQWLQDATKQARESLNALEDMNRGLPESILGSRSSVRILLSASFSLLMALMAIQFFSGKEVLQGLNMEVCGCKGKECQVDASQVPGSVTGN